MADVELVGGELRDPDAMRKAVDGCQFVFHLGALISIPYSYRHPVEVAETNFMGTLNVLIACRDLNVQRLIHTSTSEVYGQPGGFPLMNLIPCRDNLLIPPAKSGQTNWWKVFTVPISHRL